MLFLGWILLSEFRRAREKRRPYRLSGRERVMNVIVSFATAADIVLVMSFMRLIGVRGGAVTTVAVICGFLSFFVNYFIVASVFPPDPTKKRQ